jgi:hypothetical protein
MEALLIAAGQNLKRWLQATVPGRGGFSDPVALQIHVCFARSAFFNTLDPLRDSLQRG